MLLAAKSSLEELRFTGGLFDFDALSGATKKQLGTSLALCLDSKLRILAVTSQLMRCAVVPQPLAVAPGRTYDVCGVVFSDSDASEEAPQDTVMRRLLCSGAQVCELGVDIVMADYSDSDPVMLLGSSTLV